MAFSRPITGGPKDELPQTTRQRPRNEHWKAWLTGQCNCRGPLIGCPIRVPHRAGFYTDESPKEDIETFLNQELVHHDFLAVHGDKELEPWQWQNIAIRKWCGNLECPVDEPHRAGYSQAVPWLVDLYTRCTRITELASRSRDEFLEKYWRVHRHTAKEDYWLNPNRTVDNVTSLSEELSSSPEEEEAGNASNDTSTTGEQYGAVAYDASNRYEEGNGTRGPPYYIASGSYRWL